MTQIPNGKPQVDTKERFIIIPFTLTPDGSMQITQVSFRAMPQPTDKAKQWLAWKYTHDLLLRAADLALNKMLEEQQGDRPMIEVARQVPPPPGIN